MRPNCRQQTYYTAAQICKSCKISVPQLDYFVANFTELQAIRSKGKGKLYLEKDCKTIEVIKACLFQEGLSLAETKAVLSGEAKLKQNMASLREDLQDILSILHEAI